MKKLVLVLAVLLVSLPAMAAVTIDAICENGVYTVTYATDGNNVRAFALDIEVATGTITAVGSLSADYDIYPGSIVIIDGEVNDAGSAVCDDAYPDTLGGLGTAGITIEMGSLYAEGEAAPATSGTLFTFTTSETETVATITENGIRGGVVMEDPEEVAAVTINVEDCIDNVCLGDINGDLVINTVDLGLIYNMLGMAGAPYQIPTTAGNPADMNEDLVINTVDMGLLYNKLGMAGAPYQIPCP